MVQDDAASRTQALHDKVLELEAQVAELQLKAACQDVLLQHMEEGFCVLELLEDDNGQVHDYRYILSNEACLRHTAHAKQMGQTARELIPNEVDTWLPRFAEVARSGRALQFEERLAATGRWLSLSVHRLEPASDKRVAVIFTGMPTAQVSVHRLQAINQQLAERVDQADANNKLLGELVDHSLANVFAADCNLRLLAINRTAQETFLRLRGFVPQVGDHIPQLLARQPDIMSQLAPVWPRIVAGEAFVDNIALGPPEALRHYEIRYNPLRDNRLMVQGGYLFAYDITERINEQQRLRKIETALVQSQKMEAVGQLTGGIAHDFNNFLGSILAALESAIQRQDEQRYPEAARLLGAARQDAQRAAAVVQRLLAFARQQVLTPQAVDVHQLLAGMRELLINSLHAGIHFNDQTQPGAWPVRVDLSQLESSLLNLCINARDAMPSGGTLCIGSANQTLTHEQALSLDVPCGDYVRISVSDSGIGMPANVMQRASEPFFTTKPLGQGSGLGLSIVYGFIRQSRGQLQIDSVPGKGTCIDIYLPRDDTQVAAPPALPQPPPPMPARTANLIMLVENQETMRLVISEILQEQGHDVHAFGDGQHAVAALHGGLQPDLLITDIGLPGGLVGQPLGNSLPDTTPVVFITGYTSEQPELPTARRFAVLHKPFELAQLSDLVARMLAGTPLSR